jgi:transposase
MARAAAKVTCDASDRMWLERVSRSRTEETRLVERARIVLDCLAGDRNDQIASRMKLQANTVAMWRKRYLAHGVAGLRDRPRSGKPPTYIASELRTRILKQLELPAPEGQSSWDGATLAHALQVSDDAVWRILRKEGIQLRRMRSWCVSTDPEFAAKAADVIALYLGPPNNALVLSVDEKPSIQALRRRTGFVQTSSGKIVRGIQSTYKRHGTVNLFAALNVATGGQEACRLSGVSRRSGCRRARKPRGPCDPGQLQHAQEERRLAGSPSECPLPFHADLGELAQPNRDMVWHLYSQESERRQLQQYRGSHKGHPGFREQLQQNCRTVRLEKARSSRRSAKKYNC